MSDEKCAMSRERWPLCPQVLIAMGFVWLTAQSALAQSTNGISLAVSGLSTPAGLAFGPEKTLFVSDSAGGTVYRVGANGVLTVEASGFSTPRDVIFDPVGNMYVADAVRGAVYRLDASGQTTILANDLLSPCCLGFDHDGNLLVSHLTSTESDSPYNGAITRISTEGRQTLVASGFLNPQGLVVDRENNVFIAAEGFFDSHGSGIPTASDSGLFKIDPLGQVTRVLDVGSITPAGLALSSQGTLFFSGLTPQEGAVFISGSGTFEPFVTGFTQPRALALDGKVLYVADEKAGKVWRVSLPDSTVTSTASAGQASVPAVVADASATAVSASADASSTSGVDPSIARQFENMWGYHGKPDYSKIPVTPEGVPQAPPGVTCVMGHVVDDYYWGLPNVTIRLGRKAIRTNSSGYWMLTDVPSGYQMYMIDGRSADYEDTHYPIALVEWEFQPNQLNVLPYEAYLPVLDAAHTTRIDPNHETVHTTPLIPGLEIHVLAHTTITSVDGLPVTEITTTRVPFDKPMYPMGLIQDFGNHFTLQPGGAVCSKQVRVVYNNPSKFTAGTRVQLWEYAPMTHGGWYEYGLGTVSKSGLQIVPDLNAGFTTFGCGIGPRTPRRPQDLPRPRAIILLASRPIAAVTPLRLARVCLLKK